MGKNFGVMRRFPSAVLVSICLVGPLLRRRRSLSDAAAAAGIISIFFSGDNLLIASGSFFSGGSSGLFALILCWARNTSIFGITDCVLLDAMLSP
jgi:hypothetical protein